ncbi:hypothetical protein BACSTE_00436 [Bacteroides stercoris ATCC 43183]|uniref:Uncharacterized protein n=1 Tax=Bacteroides stercoris ATCC 43183 TaxID=449673 RepID=B0NLV5_BACSE|nr:hypothetical protein BACSTE_00436 [Bacteroides stercoris ATCC 43183]
MFPKLFPALGFPAVCRAKAHGNNQRCENNFYHREVAGRSKERKNMI